MNTGNLHFAIVLFALVSCAGCVNGGHVMVIGGTEESVSEFSSGGGVETLGDGPSAVRICGKDVSSNVGAETIMARDSSVKVGGNVVTISASRQGTSFGASSVKVDGRTITAPVAPLDSGMSGSSLVVIATNPEDRVIRDGGLDIRTGVSIAVIPPPDAGTAEHRAVKRKSYVEVVRQLEKRGFRLAAKDFSSVRRPGDIGSFENNVMSSGYDVGYNMALAEHSVEAPAAELILEVLDCHTDMVSGKHTVVVRVRKPLKYGDMMRSRSFRSRIPDTDVARAVASLFAEK